MVEGRPGFVKRACARESPMACFARFLKRRRSSGVERALGKGEAESSILSGGTTSIEVGANSFLRVVGRSGWYSPSLTDA